MDVLQYMAKVIRRLPVSGKKPEGRQYRELVRKKLAGGGIGSFGPHMAATPDAETSGYEEAIMQMAYDYGKIEEDWVLQAHNSGEHSYLDIMSDQVKGFAQSQQERMERVALSDGSGRLGFDSSGVLLATNRRGRVDRRADGPNGELVVRMYGSHNDVWFREGNHVEFLYSTNDTDPYNDWLKRDTPAKGYFSIKTITKNKSATAASDYVELTMNEPPIGAGNDPGALETTNYDVIVADQAVSIDTGLSTKNEGHEPYGIDALIDDSDAPMQMDTPIDSMRLPAASMHGIPSSSSFWQSEVEDGTDSYFSLDLAQSIADGIGRRAAGGSEGIRFLVMDEFQARKYSLSLTAQERYPNTGSVGKFKSGTTSMFNTFNGVDIAEKPVEKCRFQLRDRVHFVGNGIKQYILKPWSWISRDGIWHRDFNNAPKDQATASMYWNIGITNRLGSGKIENLKTS